MAHVVLAPGLRPYCNRRGRVTIDAESVVDLLDRLNHEFPGLGKVLPKDWGDDSPVRLYLDGRNVSAEAFAQTRLSADDEVMLFHAIAGG